MKASSRGEFSAAADPDDFALALSGLMDGLGVQVTLGQPDVTAARMVERCLALASSELECELTPQPPDRDHSEERSHAMTDETPWVDRPTRRTFIKRAGGTAAALSIPGLLAACGSTTPVGPSSAPSSGASTGASSAAAAATGPGGLPLARPDKPVTLPIYTDNKAIASGMQPEKGPLQLYNWIEYINPAVVKSFEKKYDVKVQISTFNTIDEAVAKIDSGAVQFDVFVPELVYLEQLVVGKILQPLNLELHPQPQGQRVAGARQPVVRRRRALHGPVHDLHHRDRLAHRQAAGL